MEGGGGYLQAWCYPLRGACCKSRETYAVAHASAEADAYKLLIRCRRRLQPARPRSGGSGFRNTLYHGGAFGCPAPVPNVQSSERLRESPIRNVGFRL